MSVVTITILRFSVCSQERIEKNWDCYSDLMNSVKRKQRARNENATLLCGDTKDVTWLKETIRHAPTTHKAK